MNKDFHYYGTYVAARLAGYDFESAQTIAHAAQYVDDSVPAMLDRCCLEGLTPIPTSHSEAELKKASGGKAWNENFLDEIGRVWPVFHFLPGNLENKETYQGPLSDSGLEANWDYDDEAKEQFKLMCLPNSNLVKGIIDELIFGDSLTLHDVGIRMHVLADTWAHKYFSGVPAWFTNRSSDFKNLTAKLENPLEMPDWLFYNSFYYLGHACAGHWPDYPFLKYQYKPKWRNEKVTKDNPGDFLLAFKQLVEALRCIKANEEFKLDTYDGLKEGKNEEIIKQILDTQMHDQCDKWKRCIPDIEVDGKKLEIPADYDTELWLTQARRTNSDPKNTDYYKFNKAAIRHFDYVKNLLASKNVFIGGIPKERILRCKLKTLEGGKYISTVEMWGQAYPTLGNSPVTLELILPDKNLVTGMNVKIRTTEGNSSLGNHLYLGAWPLDCLYYYTRDYNIFNQKWSIEQDDKEKGSPVDFTKPIVIKNQAFKDAPYIAPDRKYLTTRSKKFYFTLEKVNVE